jgi:hypothetical protein
MCRLQERTKRSLLCQVVGKCGTQHKGQSESDVVSDVHSMHRVAVKSVGWKEEIQRVDSQHSYRYPTWQGDTTECGL